MPTLVVSFTSNRIHLLMGTVGESTLAILDTSTTNRVLFLETFEF
jgi:hypothetical protein